MTYANLFMDDAAAEKAALDTKIAAINEALSRPTPMNADDKVLYERQALEKQYYAMRQMSAALEARIAQQVKQ